MEEALPRIRVKAGGRPLPSTGYLRGESEASSSPIGLSLPRPALRDRSEDIRSAWWAANSRANDAALNSGWIAGVIEQIVSLMIGTELRLNYKPDGSVFAWDAKQTRAFARDVKRRWRLWGSQPRECDAGGRYSIGQMQAAAVRQWIATGEILAELPWIPRTGCSDRHQGPAVAVPLAFAAFGSWAEPVSWRSLGCRRSGGAVVSIRAPDMDRRYGADREGSPRRVRPPRIVHIFDGVAGQVRGINLLPQR